MVIIPLSRRCESQGSITTAEAKEVERKWYKTMSDAIHDDKLFLSEEEVVDYIAEFKKDSDTLQQAREEYKKAKDNWNENLNPLFIELYSIDMYDYARDIERNIHDNFRHAHNAIYKLIKDGHSIDSIIAGKRHLDSAFTETRRISS